MIKKEGPLWTTSFFCSCLKKRPSSSNLSSQIIIGERFSYIIDQFSSSTIYRDKTKCCCPFELPKPSTTRELFLYWLWFPSFILFKKGTCSRRTKSMKVKSVLRWHLWSYTYLPSVIKTEHCIDVIIHIVCKSLKTSHLYFSILAIFSNYCSIKIDLSGNTVWPRASVFQKLAKLTIFGIFNELLSTKMCKCSSLCLIEWYFSCDYQTPCIREQNVETQLHTSFVL